MKDVVLKKASAGYRLVVISGSPLCGTSGAMAPQPVSAAIVAADTIDFRNISASGSHYRRGGVGFYRLSHFRDTAGAAMLDALELTGRSDRHIGSLPGARCRVHRAVIEPFEELRRAAARDGIDLCVLSAFRSFEEQLHIWNAKYRGERPLYGPDGNVLEHATLAENELLACILRWSALPGASRHHWGSDMDVIDRSDIPAGYTVRLMPDEFGPSGVFARLGRWLDSHLQDTAFFRPYAMFSGGVEREPWHLSYAPVAVPALGALTPALLGELIGGSDVLGKDRVLADLPAIYARYVANITAYLPSRPA